MYRIVQEALTNTVKHASAHQCPSDSPSRRRRLALTVTDDGRGPGTTTGTGLIGIRERAAAHGGTAAHRDGARRPGVPGPGEDPAYAMQTDAHGRHTGWRLTIRVVVADDQELVRSGFAMILDAQPDIEVVAEAGDGAAAVDAVRRLAPEVALLDIRMPGMDGIEACRTVCAETACRTVMLTTFDSDEYVYEALHAGAERLSAQGRAPGRSGACGTGGGGRATRCSPRPWHAG